MRKHSARNKFESYSKKITPHAQRTHKQTYTQEKITRLLSRKHPELVNFRQRKLANLEGFRLSSRVIFTCGQWAHL